jgi:membrane protease YdiL (CAAX protease family)
MNPFDETPGPAEPGKEQPAAGEGTPQTAEHARTVSLESDAVPPPPPADAAPPSVVRAPFPEDLQISWSWPHFLIFVIFGFISLIVIQTAMAAYYAAGRHLPPKELEQYLVSNPKFAIGSMVVWYVVLFFFLYVTLSMLRGHPFWQILGWRKIEPRVGELPRNPLVYFAAGCGLSLFIAIVSSQMKTPENAPIEEMFKHRDVALMFVAMAVLLAPLVEETLFRGYLYPLLARSFGVAPAIILTGLCFGAMHGAQLGWTWSLVGMLAVVGIVFTIVRARTGSVFASYLMHLGYNSLISFFAIVGTHGFTKLPTDH